MRSNYNSNNLNITPDNKKNKSNCHSNRNTFNNIEKSFKGYSFSELQYMDKENNPPIPRESSRFINTNEASSPLEINIELGISHLNLDQYCQQTLEIPITIDTKYYNDDKENINNHVEIPLVKEYLVIFNTISLDFNEIFTFLRVAAEKMNNNDKLYSNIFSNETWLTKGDLESLLNLENNLNFFQKNNYLNTEGIIQAIDFCVEISLENNSNIFSVILIHELKELYEFNSNNVKEELLKIAKKLQEKRVLMVKNFSINSVILNSTSSNHKSFDEKANSDQEKFKFISFLYELSYLTMGSNFVVKVYLYLSNYKIKKGLE